MSDAVAVEMKRELTGMLYEKMAECGWECTSQTKSAEFEEGLKSVDDQVNGFFWRLYSEIDNLEEEMAEETKDKKKMNAAQIKKKFEMEIALVRMKMKVLKMKFQAIKPPEVVVETRAILRRAIKRMTSFDLMTGNGYFLADNNGSEREAVFRWRGYPVVSRLQPLYDARGRAHLSLYFGRGDPEPFPANVRPLPNVYYVLTDAEGAKSACFNASYVFGAGCDLDFRHNLPSGLEHTSVQVYVEPPAMTRLVHSYDGSLSWTIDQYSDRKRMEAEGLIEWQESPYFYTGPSGYRVRVHVYLDGEGAYKGQGLTARVSFLTGAFDEELRGDFPHRTTVSLPNRLHPLFPVQKTVEKNIVAEKCYSLDVCENKHLVFLVLNDALLINVAIKAL